MKGKWSRYLRNAHQTIRGEKGKRKIQLWLVWGEESLVLIGRGGTAAGNVDT